MTLLDEFDTTWLGQLHEMHEMDSHDGQPVVVYRLSKPNITVTLTRGNHMEPVVEFAMGSEVCTFLLAEFVHFWLTMIEIGRRTDSAYLEAIEKARRRAGSS